MHSSTAIVSMAGTDSILMECINVWLADASMAHDQSGMGSFGNDDQFGDPSFFSSFTYNRIS